jgi:hypothetical protein
LKNRLVLHAVRAFKVTAASPMAFGYLETNFLRGNKKSHCAVANIAEHSLSIAPLPTENYNILGLKFSLHHWKQIPNLFIAPLPTAVCSEYKATDRAVSTLGNFCLFPSSQQLYEVAL